MAAIISIGAGPGQLPLIRAAHELGFEVIAVDRKPAAECLPFVSESIINSTFDADGVLAGLENISKQFDIKGVLARTSGPAILTAARVAEYLNVPGVPVIFAEASVAKSVLREEAAAEHLSTPMGECTQSFIKPVFSPPWVVKPDAPLVGKKNVYRVNDLQAFGKSFAAACSESQNDAVEVEAFIDGVDVGYTVLLSEGKIVFDLLYDEFVVFNDDRACGLGIGGPSVFSGTLIEEQAHSIARTLLARWQSTGGFAFFSFRVNKNGVFLYEANPGLCGDAIADKLLPSIWPGFDAFRAEVLTVTGGKVEVPQTVAKPFVVLKGELMQSGSAEDNLNLLSSFAGGNEIIEKTRLLLS